MNLNITVFIEIHVIYLKVLKTNLLAKAEILFTRSHLITQPELGYLLQSPRSPSLYLYFLTPFWLSKLASNLPLVKDSSGLCTFSKWENLAVVFL